jgi:hypothetical protein
MQNPSMNISLSFKNSFIMDECHSPVCTLLSITWSFSTLRDLKRQESLLDLGSRNFFMLFYFTIPTFNQKFKKFVW